jgi:sarcosine oxidase subunit beta
MSKLNVEILIIGAGVMGSSIAYHLARQGRQVLVLEQSEVAVSPAASWASAGGVRRQGRHPAEALLAIEAIERWQTLEQELDADLHYRRGGNLMLAETEADAAYLASFVSRQQAQGFTDVRLVDRQEAHALVPGLSSRAIAGSYSPTDGQADPVRTTRAFAAAAQRYGVTYKTGSRVTALLREGDRVIGVRTEQEELQAEQVVLAAGAWSDDIATSIGLRLPIRTRALQMVLSTPASALTLAPVLSAVGRMLSLKQLPDRTSYTLRPDSISGNWTTARELLSAVGQQRIARAWCGLEAQSIDDIPFIGRLTSLEGLVLALGFSGHGFALSPAVGRAIADLLAGRPTPELGGLRPDRIASFSFEQVEAFVYEQEDLHPYA